MATSGGGGGPGGGQSHGAGLVGDPETQRRLALILSSSSKLKTYLDLYKPSKYSPEVCRAKEEIWTDKVERALMELNENTFRLKELDEDYDHDNTIKDIIQAVSDFTLAISVRAMSISGPGSQVPNQSLSQNVSSVSDSSMNERRKAVAMVEVDTEKLTIDIKSLSEELRCEDDWGVADDHTVRTAMAEISDWKKRFNNIQTALFSIKRTIRTHGLEDSRLAGPEAAVTNLQSELEMVVADIEYEDRERHLFTLSRSKSAPVKLPSYSGEAEENYQEFEKELRAAFRSNSVMKSEQVKVLKDCLKGSPRSMISEGLKDIDNALRMLSTVYGNSTTMMKAKKAKLVSLGKLPKPGSKAAPHLRTQVEWYLQMEVLIESLQKLACDNKDNYCEIYAPSLFGSIKELFPYDMTLEMQNNFTGDTENKMSQFLEYIRSKRSGVQGMLRECPAGVSGSGGSASAGSGGGSGGGLSGGKQNSFFTKQRGPFRDEKCRVCRQLEDDGDTEDLYEDHFSNTAYGCPRFAKMTVSQRRNIAFKARMCYFCLDSKYVKKKKSDRHEDCPAFVKKQTYSCNSCKFHFLVCEKHLNSNNEKMENSKKFWTEKGKDFSVNLIVSAPSSFSSSSVAPQVPMPPEVTASNATSKCHDSLFKATKKLREMAKGKVKPVPEGDPLFLFSKVAGKTRDLNCFYDLGCSHAMFQSDIPVKELVAQRTKKGPLQMSAAGDTKVVVRDEWACVVPLVDGSKQTLIGLTADSITGAFPEVNITKAVSDIIASAPPEKYEYLRNLKLPETAGGKVDILLGILFASCHPEVLHQMESGLFIARVKIANHGGYTACIGGPHQSFNMMANHVGDAVRLMNCFVDGLRSYHDHGPPKLPSVMMTLEDMELAKLVNAAEVASVAGVPTEEGHEVTVDTEQGFGFSIQCNLCGDDVTEDLPALLDDAGVLVGEERMCQLTALARESEPDERLWDLKTLVKLQEAGISLEYRCPRCRNCNDCRQAPDTERISLREEAEDQAIRDSVFIDYNARKIVAKLPMRGDESKFLSSNRDIAQKVLTTQCVKVQNDPTSREAAIKSFKKLLDNGYAVNVNDLPEEERKNMFSKPVQHYLPWRLAWKLSSVSSPCRVVMDASSKTRLMPDGSGGHCLNNLTVKGKVSTLDLLSMILRFLVGAEACSGDLKQFYTSIGLHPSQWNLQRVLWKENMDIDSKVLELVIISLIFGVRSVSALSETAIIRLADHVSQSFPRLEGMLKRSRFVDDLAHSEAKKEIIKELISEADKLFESVGLTCKGWSVSGEPPHKDCTHDGIGVDVGGFSWWPEVDSIQVKVPELHFGKKARGKLAVGTEVFEGSFADLNKFVPKDLTRRQVVSKYAEVFDFIGKWVPVTAAMKHDIRRSVKETESWDGILSAELRSQWVKNFWRLQKLKGIQYNRAIIPADAANTELELIAMGDAANDLKICGVWGRFLRKNGEYSCRLIIGRSLLGKENSSIPKEELEALTATSNLLWMVRRSLSDWVADYMLMSDSVIALCWTTTENRRLSLFHRNRVVQTRLNSDLDKCWWVSTLANPSDVGTRADKVDNQSVGPGSVWENGCDWMTGSIAEAADKGIIKPAGALRIADKDEDEYEKGMVLERTPELLVKGHVVTTERVEKMQERSEFSDYIIQPVKRNFKSVVNITAMVFKFIRILKEKAGHNISRSDKVYKKFSASYICWGSEKSGLNVTNDKPKCHLEDDDVSRSLDYWYRKATKEVEHFVKPETVSRVGVKKDGILYCRSRIMDGQRFLATGNFDENNLGLDIGLSLMTPLVERHSPIAYSIALFIHNCVGKHAGYESCYRLSLSYVHILQGASLFKILGEECSQCHRIRKKYLEVVHGPVSPYQLTLAPCFYVAYVDLAGPYHTYVPGHERKTRNMQVISVKNWVMTFMCATSKLSNLQVIESKCSEATLEGLMRLGCEVGFPTCLVLDQESSFLKMVRDAEISLSDLNLKCYKEFGIRFETAPVSGHNHIGLVERRIKTITEAFEKIDLKSKRLHATGLQTVCKLIENDMNNTPLGTSSGRNANNTEMLKIITPNMLRMGRLNSRSLAGPMRFPSGPKDYLKKVNECYEAWFKVWNTSVIPTLIPQPKWFKDSGEIKVEDVVYFRKTANELSSTWTVGQVESVTKSKDGVVRRVEVRYHNAGDVSDKYAMVEISPPKFTDRAVRSLVKLFSIEDAYFIEDMNEVERTIKEMDRRAHLVKNIVTDRVQRCEDGSYNVNLIKNIECDKVCCCAGHCGHNHHPRMKTLSQLMRGDPRVQPGVTDAVLYPDVTPADGHDPLDVGLLPHDVDDEVWRILTSLETKFSLE